MDFSNNTFRRDIKNIFILMLWYWFLDIKKNQKKILKSKVIFKISLANYFLFISFSSVLSKEITPTTNIKRGNLFFFLCWKEPNVERGVQPFLHICFVYFITTLYPLCFYCVVIQSSSRTLMLKAFLSIQGYRLLRSDEVIFSKYCLN